MLFLSDVFFSRGPCFCTKDWKSVDFVDIWRPVFFLNSFGEVVDFDFSVFLFFVIFRQNFGFFMVKLGGEGRFFSNS